jgi:hypothetical protein
MFALLYGHDLQRFNAYDHASLWNGQDADVHVFLYRAWGVHDCAMDLEYAHGRVHARGDGGGGAHVHADARAHPCHVCEDGHACERVHGRDHDCAGVYLSLFFSLL